MAAPIYSTKPEWFEHAAPSILFNNLARKAPVNPTQDGHDKNYSPQTPEPSDPSPIPTRPMNLSTIDSWETPHATTDDNTFYSKDEPRRVHSTSPLDETFHSDGEPGGIYLMSSQSPPSAPRKMKKKLEMRMSFAKKAECRSTTARPADRWFPQKRTLQDR